MNKKIPVWLALLFLWFSCLITLLFGWAVWHIETSGSIFKEKTSNAILFVASFPSVLKEYFEDIAHPNPVIRPDFYPNIAGLKTEKNYIDSNYMLISVYDKKLDQSVVKLLRLSDQKTVYQWVPNFDQIKVRFGGMDAWHGANKRRFNIAHPLLSTDGSIVFHILNSPLVKIDKNSKLIWILNDKFHHSHEFDAQGNIWGGSFIEHSKTLPGFLKNFEDDAIAKVSPDGKLLFKKSVAEILIENGYRALIFGVGMYDRDLVHLNDVQPALSTTRYWAKDDLLISLRHKSTVFLYRPSTNKILWLKTGPWLNQHDVNFIDSSCISIFGNDITRSIIGDRLLEGHNEEYIFDFKTNKIETPYTEFLKNAKVSTLSEGRSEILPNGNLFVEETNKNRLLMGNTKNILWQYVSRIDRHHVSALSWTRYITKEEFTKLTFLKNN
jgi:hypothetical protein